MTDRDSRDRSPLRASDADRERVANALRQAVGDGRISLEEFQERLDAAYAARTADEVNGLLRGLTGNSRTEEPREILELRDEEGVTCAGRWLVPRRMEIWTYGDVLIDFTDAVITYDALHIYISQENYTRTPVKVTFIVKSGITVDIDHVRSAKGVRVSGQTDPYSPGILRVRVTGEVANDIVITTRKRATAGLLARRVRRIVW